MRIQRLAVCTDFLERRGNHRRHAVAASARRGHADGERNFVLNEIAREIGGIKPRDEIEERGRFQIVAARADRRHANQPRTGQREQHAERQYLIDSAIERRIEQNAQRRRLALPS